MILARILPMLACLAGLASLATLPAPASAQTAGDINRLNAAIQICNSPMGAGMAECAKLRGQLGMGRAQGLGGVGGGGAGGGTSGALLGALGAAMNARQAPAPAAPIAPAANPQMIAECVRAAAGNTAAIQACLNTASAPRLAVAAPLPAVPRLGQPLMSQPLPPQPGMGQNAAIGIHQAGQSYQACVAANPSNWQSCLPLLNGGQAR
jgi:hypothetical protein